jgi:hypothetical protein
MTPEQKARQEIDTLLRQCGWLIQDYRAVNLSAGPGIAIREVPMREGKADYLLCVDRKAIGIIEAKKVGALLSGVAEQLAQYAESLPDFMDTIVPGHCRLCTSRSASARSDHDFIQSHGAKAIRAYAFPCPRDTRSRLLRSLAS